MPPQALALDPENKDLVLNLGMALKEMCCVERAEKARAAHAVLRCDVPCCAASLPPCLSSLPPRPSCALVPGAGSRGCFYFHPKILLIHSLLIRPTKKNNRPCCLARAPAPPGMPWYRF